LRSVTYVAGPHPQKRLDSFFVTREEMTRVATREATRSATFVQAHTS
jgi:hypothetical protein